ncbi:MAG: alginate export family protein [Planctomycetota bacterium]
MIAKKFLRRRALVCTLISGLLGANAMAADGLVDVQVSGVGEVAQTANYAPLLDHHGDHAVEAAPEGESVVMEAPVAEGSAMPAPVAAPAYEPVPMAVPCNTCTTCCTDEKKEKATAAMKGAYKGVFYANDFSYLNDPCYDGPSFLGDGLKGLMDGRLDIGGEARVRYHSENNHRARVPGLRGGGASPSGLGLTNNDDEFFLTRLRLFANYRVNDWLRLYGEYLYADSGGETFSNRPIEENRGEIQNLFFDVALTDSLSARVGRQELLLGAQRLVSPLDWANTRRSFEGARGTYKGDGLTVDGFFVHPLNRNTANESKIDDANENVDFYGVYATKSGLDIGTLDAYYLGLDNSVVDFSYHTIGTRLFGKTDGGTLFEFEGGFQFGDNAPGLGSHGAGFFTGGLGRVLNIGDWKPTVWMWYDYASGEEDFADASRGDDGFDHLFPLAHKYNGFMDLFGRRNLHDINAQFITPVAGSKKVKLLLWYHYFLLDELTTPYDVTMNPYNTVSQAGDRELGHELDVLFNIGITPRQSLLIGYSYFSAGDYYDTTAGVPNNDADFFYTQYQARF